MKIEINGTASSQMVQFVKLLIEEWHALDNKNPLYELVLRNTGHYILEVRLQSKRLVSDGRGYEYLPDLKIKKVDVRSAKTSDLYLKQIFEL